MERKRNRLRFFSEEEEEEDRHRRSSQRFRKRVRYNEDDEDEEEEEEKEEEEEVNEHPGPSTQNTSNLRTQENRLLPVTCGNKKGILDVEKLDRGELCIECEGHWISPPAFEDLGGKGPSKKWKTSIFHENKPLQFWFEHKKVLSSDHESESASEVSEIGLQSAEETEVKDEDWKPGSEELTPETLDEEERVGAESEGEVVEEEDKMEDEDIPAVADTRNENSVCEGIWFTPLDENAQGEEERGHDALAKDDTCVTSAPHIDPTQMSEPPIIGDIKEENGEHMSESVTQNNLLKTEDGELETSHCGEKEKELRRRAMGPERQRQLIEHFEDCDSANNEHLHMPKSEAGGQAFANENVSNTNTTPIQRGFKEESVEALGVGPSSSPRIIRVESKSDKFWSTSGHNVAELQEMEQQKRCPQTVQALDVVEGPSSEPTTGFYLDTMDLDQLKRAKIKMQLKVLQLKEEYYTLQIQKFKQ
ncbi:hypothetical protein PAMP_009453 [Pampus punctatissimus]